jgi:hypothetical protein
MNWKEFFYPTKGKIVLALLLPFTLGHASFDTNQFVISIPPYIFWQVYFVPLAFYLTLMIQVHISMLLWGAQLSLSQNTMFEIPNIVTFIINYFLACIIVFRYKELIMKKKGKK